MSAAPYDYIIVGGGSAGCVLANRLSLDRSARVLLLEAGGRDAHPYIKVPLGVGQLHKHRMFDWGYESDPEPGLGGRQLEAMRGKVVGGSSSVNMMAHTRGNALDFDRWARNGAHGWSHAEVLPYFKRSETWEGVPSGFRGDSGPVGVRWSSFEDPLNDAWIEAGRACGFGVVGDYNAASQEGFGRAQFAIRKGRRSSSGAAYLRPVLHRKNLKVATRAQATRIVFEGRRAVGVEYVRRGRVEQARAKQEVILCAGTFDTPKLLMLSGIGPAAHLREMGIHVLADLSVGMNLQDHVAVQLYWSRQGNGPFRDTLRADRIGLAMARALLFGAGPATALPNALHAFVRTDAACEVPDIEFMFRCAPANAAPWFAPFRKPYSDGYGIRPTLLHPRSRGRVMLRSADPREPVRLQFKVFADDEDLRRLREGFKRGREIGESAAMSAFRGAELMPGKAVRDDDQIDAWMRRTAVTAHHPAGTCAMGGGPEAVVGPDLHVRGVDGLRVADASVMPDMVSAHINAAVLMIGEKAADMILSNARC